MSVAPAPTPAPIASESCGLGALSYRVATVADAAAIDVLVNSAYRGESSKAGWTTEADLLGGQRTDAEALRDEIAVGAASASSHILLMHRDGSLIGTVNVQRKDASDSCPASAYIGMFVISPTLQGGGLGKALLSQAESYAVQTWPEVVRFEMTVIAQRTELIEFYERRGFVRTGAESPFPYNDERFGLPKRPDLKFVVLEKQIKDRT